MTEETNNDSVDATPSTETGLNVSGILTTLDVLNAMDIKEADLKKVEGKLSIRQLSGTASSFINVILDGDSEGMERLCVDISTFKPLLKRASIKPNLSISTTLNEITLKAGRSKTKIRQISQEYYRERGPPIPTEGWLKFPFVDFVESVESCLECGNTMRLRLVKDKGLLVSSQDSENSFVSAFPNPATLSDNRSFFSVPLLLPMLSVFKKKKDITEIEVLVNMNAALMLRFKTDGMSVFYVLAQIDLKGSDSKELPNVVSEEELSLFQ